MPYLRQAGYVLSFTGFLISGLYVICARSYKDFLMSRAMKSSPNHTPGTALTAVWLLLLYGITLLHPWYGGTRGGMHAARATRYEHAQPGTSTRDRNTRSSLVRWVSPTFSTFESTPVIIHGRRAKCWLMYRFVLAFHSRARVQNLRYRTWRSRQRPHWGMILFTIDFREPTQGVLRYARSSMTPLSIHPFCDGCWALTLLVS